MANSVRLGVIDWLCSLASLLQLIEGEKKRQALMDLLLIEQKHCVPDGSFDYT